MTTQYKDLFISYGRRESLGFVARLHQRLKLAGYDAWFDKINIPDGEDYAARINYGIESAHNFVYVMAPRALCSPYCLIEIEYARYLGKRVIPINQMVIFQTEDKPLSESDKAVLHGFYARYGLDDPNIETTQQVLNRSLAAIGRTDWLDGKEKLSDDDCNALFKWAQGYENFWHKHEEVNYLQTAELPQFGQAVDSLTSIIERMQTVIERHKKHVTRHTDLMMQALTWSHNQYANHYLLVGKERTVAEDWLAREFRDGEQAPCEANALLCDFICESRKNGENKLTDCFICYAHEDKAVRDAVLQSLARYAITAWRHDKDIDKGQTYEQAIEAGIEGADNVLFFVSPHSVQSVHCLRELAHALQYNKRLIPLLITETLAEQIPEAVRSLQFINFANNQDPQVYDSRIADILNIVRQEATYYNHHKMLLVQALRWQQQQQQASFLLRGHNLENAKTWLRLNQEREQHAPIALHQELINTSEAAKGRLHTEVFLSYSRKDADFARKLNLSLQAAGKNVWFDQESIASGMDFEAELYKGINGADNFVFVLSPDSVISKYCEDEVNYAVSQGKRIFTVLCREIDPETLPSALRKLNWIDFLNIPFEKSFTELVQALDLDREHAAQHTVLQQRALEWTENQQSADFLLNNSACTKAEAWQTTAKTKAKQPAPTQLQQRYIQNSRSAITAAQRKEKRRQQWILSSVSLGLVFALILAGFAWLQMQKAEKQRNVALLSQSRFLIKEANYVINNDLPLMSMRLALEAAPNTSETTPNRPLAKELYDTLSQSINRHYQGVFEYEQVVKGVGFSPDGQHFLSYAADTAYVWDMNTRQLTTLLRGHQDLIKSATYSPDGAYIVTASADNTARIWDSRTGRLLAKLAGHKNSVLSASYSPDGHYIVTASYDNTAHVWDSRSGELLGTLTGHTEPVNSALYSPDGKQIVTASADDTARIWDSHTMKLLTVLKGHQGDVNSAIYSPNGKQLVTASADNTARVWQSDTGALVATLEGHSKSLYSACYNRDGSRIVTASADRTARVWDSQTGGLLANLEGHSGPVLSATYSPSEQYIVTASTDKTARIWNSHTGELHATLTGHKRAINSAIYHPSENYLISTSYDKTARVWDSQGNVFLATLNGHLRDVTSAEYSPDGKRIVTASNDRTARIWDSDSSQLLVVLSGHEDWIRYAGFSPDGNTIITASADNTARIWDSHTGALLLTLQGHDDIVYAALYSPDSERIVTASADGTVRTWDSHTGALLLTMKGHNEMFSAIFSPDGKQIVASSVDKHAWVWDSHTGVLQNTLTGHKDRLYTAIYSSDGKQIVTASADNSARVWDSRTGDLLLTLIGHTASVQSAMFSPDNSRIVTASDDNTARIWDSHTGELLVTLNGHKDSVFSATYSPDGQYIVTASADNSARIWLAPASLAEMLQQAQRFLPKYRDVIGAKQLSGMRLLCTERAAYFLEIIERCAEVQDENIRGSEYLGEFDSHTGKAHGQGETQGVNYYKGGFKQGLKHGDGVYTWADGTQWAGMFNEDLAEGIGELKVITTGWYEAAKGESNLKQAIALLETQLKILPQHSNTFLLWGEILAKQNQDTQALEKFQQAFALDPSLNFDPDTKISQLHAEFLIEEVGNLSFKTKAEDILQKIDQALQLNTDTIDAYDWSRLCWAGALNQHAQDVLKLCELAVAKEPDNALYMSVRGLARALTGNLREAAEDFRFFVTHKPDDEDIEYVRAWLASLEQGENPFTEAVLERLRQR